MLSLPPTSDNNATGLDKRASDISDQTVKVSPIDTAILPDIDTSPKISVIHMSQCGRA